MAVPKRKMSRSNTRHRRSQWKTSAPVLVPCNNRACRQPKLQHVACPHCGTYDGRQVVRPA
ncbi:50S ribosomal protein L32 [Longimycelium tulufanense]|uniref:Large ribosomal subunit protein bL32 n=1 Tax=Longimycelium tulufanense TaxID=907463 RepID=A0A8J3C8G2_9PSEU|nr:50S ribosomal protein L32 [Longimycelium tulufanense]GGM40479.1 50S ribosomal protein L32 [Longimycelium tulufanense]